MEVCVSGSQGLRKELVANQNAENYLVFVLQVYGTNSTNPYPAEIHDLLVPQVCQRLKPNRLESTDLIVLLNSIYN